MRMPSLDSPENHIKPAVGLCRGALRAARDHPLPPRPLPASSGSTATPRSPPATPASSSAPPTYGTQVGGFTGYWGKTDASYPKVGDRYWGHIYYTVIGRAAASGSRRADGDRRCRPARSWPSTPARRTPTTSSSCTRTNLNGTDDHRDRRRVAAPGEHDDQGQVLRVRPRTSRARTARSCGYALLAQGQSFDIVFPLQSTRKLSGIGEPNNAVAHDGDADDSGGHHDRASVPVGLRRRPPGRGQLPGAPAPTTPAITNTTGARARASCATGTARATRSIEIGEGAAGAFVPRPRARSTTSTPSIQGYYIDQDWSSLKPGTDYHWRLKFTDTKGTATTTDDQIHLGQPADVQDDRRRRLRAPAADAGAGRAAARPAMAAPPAADPRRADGQQGDTAARAPAAAGPAASDISSEQERDRARRHGRPALTAFRQGSSWATC